MYFIYTGDVRANVQPGLSALHTIFMREHNRIAQHFIDHFDWDGKKVFEETRRYIAAEIQHITYNEFLPKLINETILELFGLVPLSNGYFTGYDPYVRPMIRNAFATAAYRMGHSLLRKTFFFSGSNSDLHTQFNRPDHIYEDWGIEKCTRGLYENSAQSIDEKITEEVTWKLFEVMAKDGGDLAAFNIQRGRDHGFLVMLLGFIIAPVLQSKKITLKQEYMVVYNFTAKTLLRNLRMPISKCTIDDFILLIVE